VSNFYSSGSPAELVPAIAPLIQLLLDNGYSALEDSILKIEESLHIEFKSKQNASSAELDEGDQRSLGEALSGFSNAEGGILIWGVKSHRKNSNDVCGKLEPISEIEQFHGKLKSLFPSYLSPPNHGVFSFVINAPCKPDRGFVVVIIPKSPTRPCMSNAPKSKQFFRKESDRIRKMEHYEIADMFRVAENPIFHVSWHMSHWNRNGQGDDELLLHIMVKNIGDVAAEEPYLWIKLPDVLLSFEPFKRNLRDTRGLDGFVKFPGLVGVSLPPDDIDEFCNTPLCILGEQLGSVHCSWGRNRRSEHEPIRSFICDTKLECWVGAKNAKKQQFDLTLLKDELEQKAKEICGY
jgi:hypothetical protein